MAYIYKITNDINGKIQIGKTEFSVEKRFKEHCHDRINRKYENRPLYQAMNKYGIEHFHIETIEETDNPSEREKYWIEYYGSFKNGYNATLGGDGTKYIDYDLVIATYNELHSLIDTSKKLGIHQDSVRNILISRKQKIYSRNEVLKEKYSKIVNQYDLQGKYITSFSSLSDAARSLGITYNTGIVSHISAVCKGKRKTAYGYIWRYGELV